MKQYLPSGGGNHTAAPQAQLVLDPTKSAYQAFSIPSSTLAAYGAANVWYYIRAICCRGRRSIAVQGEAGQLGADFVISPSGKILLAHYCRNPTDRVSISKIVDAVVGPTTTQTATSHCGKKD